MLPLTLKLWLWANPMTEDPGRPASCSNCSSGGENTAFFCVKMSPPPVAKKRSVCTGVATASQLTRPDTMLRHTDSRFLNSATVWNGFENAYGAVDGQVAPSHTLAGSVAMLPSGQRARKSMKLGIEDRAACGGLPLFSLLNRPRSPAVCNTSPATDRLTRLPTDWSMLKRSDCLSAKVFGTMPPSCLTNKVEEEGVSSI